MSKAEQDFYYRHSTPILKSKEHFPHLDHLFLVWVGYGVYFGYPENEIIGFCRRILKGKGAPPGTAFSGTGYICAEGTDNKQQHMRDINARRYATTRFPEEGLGDHAESLKKWFTDEDFFGKVLGIANKVEKKDES